MSICPNHDITYLRIQPILCSLSSTDKLQAIHGNKICCWHTVNCPCEKGSPKIPQLLLSFARGTKLTPLNLKKNVLVVLIGCGFVVNISLTSPGYPNNYPSNMVCNYSLPIPQGKNMKIFFDFFDLEDDGTSCR